MMLKKTIDVDITVEDVVKIFIRSDAQAALFNAMAIDFLSFSGGDGDGRQMLYIKDELTDEGKAFIAKLNEYVNGE